MSARVGLAVLLALVAAIPVALATRFVDSADDEVLREAAAERTDRVADAWRGFVQSRLDRREQILRRHCDNPSARALITFRDSPRRPVPPTPEELDAMTRRWIATERGLARAIECEDGRRLHTFLTPALLLEGVPRYGSVEVELGEPDAPSPVDRDRRFAAIWNDQRGAPVLALAVSLPRLRVGAPARLSRNAWLQLTAIAAAILAFGLGLVVERLFNRALTQLERAAQRIGRGDLEIELEPAATGGSTFTAFNQMAKELKEAQDRARRAERVAAWRDIARRIAHEIKNPLMPIRTSMETMRRTKARQHPEFDEIFDESTQTVLEEVARLERIVTEFSRFARLPRPRPTPIDLRELIQQVVLLHSPEPRTSVVATAIQVEFPESIGWIGADRDQLTQVLVNLVQNALDASHSSRGEQGTIRIAVTLEPPEHVVVTVHDDGPGIPEAERAQVLEPYYTTKSGGTGLGLAIVERIVSDHGGSLSIGDSPLGGASIQIRLSREGPPAPAEGSHTF